MSDTITEINPVPATFSTHHEFYKHVYSGGERRVVRVDDPDGDAHAGIGKVYTLNDTGYKLRREGPGNHWTDTKEDTIRSFRPWANAYDGAKEREAHRNALEARATACLAAIGVILDEHNAILTSTSDNAFETFELKLDGFRATNYAGINFTVVTGEPEDWDDDRPFTSHPRTTLCGPRSKRYPTIAQLISKDSN